MVRGLPEPEERGVFMMAFVTRLVRSKRAQDLAEYAIALAVIGSLASAIGIIIAGNVADLWNTANTIIAIAAS
jgi:hypothetical protein